MEMAEKTKKRRNIMIGIETSVFKIGVTKKGQKFPMNWSQESGGVYKMRDILLFNDGN